MHSIDGYAYASSIARVDPTTKAVFSIIPLLLTLCLPGAFAGIAACLLMFIASTHYGTITKKQYAKLLMAPMAFLLIGALTVVFGRFELWQGAFGVQIGGYIYGVNRESLMQGLALSARALGAVSCMYFLSLNTPMTDILTVLKRAHVPGFIIALMELIYRFIFVIFDEAGRMSAAQHSRLGYRDFKTSLRSMGELIANLFLRAFTRCNRVNDALESRGYDGNFDSLTEEYQSMSALYLWCGAVSLCLALAFLLERGLQWI